MRTFVITIGIKWGRSKGEIRKVFYKANSLAEAINTFAPVAPIGMFHLVASEVKSEKNVS